MIKEEREQRSANLVFPESKPETPKTEKPKKVKEVTADEKTE